MIYEPCRMPRAFNVIGGIDFNRLATMVER
ncbi:hypothetical protein Pla52o_19760 [Novipirellula galeiformis]|uniref:Uncharacterized protein n=1 Tax=Novipirellula galeiformis TaxID=2528004 RepID=A0A5C6CGM4_9BACT|nr:hypothetical protein Pla52o_19760 [Novipirellula galeiformis]